jgi:beta-galactosidase
VGSEFYNTLAGILGDKTMKIGATLPMCDWKTKDAFANMDIAGYNYGILRYGHDLKKYPNRLILGSETFCKDAYAFYEQAKKEPRIVGDFVWAGMDYMGEAGIGSWEYEDYAPKETEDPGWLKAGSGRLNILGYALGEAAYTSVALEKELGPRIAVRPVYQTGSHTPSAWKMTDAMESWSWPGCEGQTASVEVYARAASVELLLNGQSVRKKNLHNCCNVTFRIPYAPGTLTAVSYDERGNEINRTTLQSAGTETQLTIQPEETNVRPGGLSFVRLRYTDQTGTWKPMEKHRIKIAVENGELMGFGNACPYNPDGYWKNETRTYYGEAMAVVRAGRQGSTVIRVTDEHDTYRVELPIMEEGKRC